MLVPMTDQPTGLRERKKADTRRALSDAALNLAFERGLENVTRDEIASLAGVSLRTFNNYFSGKYEALAYRQAERMRRRIPALQQRAAVDIDASGCARGPRGRFCRHARRGEPGPQPPGTRRGPKAAHEHPGAK